MNLPLSSIKVVEFTHMVMGPTCGMVLGDMGAQVVKVEPIEGDRTRTLLGAGAGFFPMFNRNKQSIRINLRDPKGAQIARKLCIGADVVIENFKPQSLSQYGLDYAQLSPINPRLIYAALKGFLPGPYEHRTALDEVVQMMGGLAYMTGRSGDPLRAGSSVNDIMGGLFAVIAILTAIIERQHTGKGQEIQSGLFENNVFLVGQHIMQYAVTQKPPAPMPERLSPWAIYDVFQVADGQIFLAVVSDSQWNTFCQALGYPDWAENPKWLTNNQRVEDRPNLLPELRQRLSAYSVKTLAELFEKVGLPFAPITKPHELIDDPHLQATAGLGEIILTDGARQGQKAPSALLPILMAGRRFGVHTQPPQAGEHTQTILQSLGISENEWQQLKADGVVA